MKDELKKQPVGLNTQSKVCLYGYESCPDMPAHIRDGIPDMCGGLTKKYFINRSTSCE